MKLKDEQAELQLNVTPAEDQEYCKYCTVKVGSFGSNLISVNSNEYGVYIYRNDSGEYELIQNISGCTSVSIVACPACGRNLNKEGD